MLTDISISYDQFREIANITSLDAPYEVAGRSFSGISTKSTARRLRRTRQNLGSYRHDLLVAMRVVNNVEREMMKAEWENWLLDENSRCKQIQKILQTGISNSPVKRGSKVDTQKILDSDIEKFEGLAELRKWQAEYCGSCKLEQDLLLEGRKHLTFG